jgi:hypothetical protein
MMNLLFKPKAARDIERAKVLAAAKAVISLEETEGWKHFVEKAEGLIQSMTPDVSSFGPEDAVRIAAQMAFISGSSAVLA